MRFHVLGFAHTKTSPEYCACAYTQKVWKLCQMLRGLKHEVIHYGAEGSYPECSETVDVLSDAAQKAVYDYDKTRSFFKWDPNDSAFQLFNRNAIFEIVKREQPQDFLLCMGGTWHKPIADHFPAMTVVEPGIGYEGIFSRFRVFESYAWMHYMYGRLGSAQVDGTWFDAVIPNYFDETQFEIRPKKDYFLYFGRLIPRKGLRVVADIAERLKIKVLCVGQGALSDPGAGPDDCGITSEYLEHRPAVGIEERKILMAEARALFLPTYYLEPFGGVAVEAQMSGTPVITTDWGAFPETVRHGETGYRCRTLEQFIWATKNVHLLSSRVCRQWAVENFGLDRVAGMYQEYFEMLFSLWGKGWYADNPTRAQLDWLTKDYGR